MMHMNSKSKMRMSSVFVTLIMVAVSIMHFNEHSAAAASRRSLSFSADENNIAVVNDSETMSTGHLEEPVPSLDRDSSSSSSSTSNPHEHPIKFNRQQPVWPSTSTVDNVHTPESRIHDLLSADASSYACKWTHQYEIEPGVPCSWSAAWLSDNDDDPLEVTIHVATPEKQAANNGPFEEKADNAPYDHVGATLESVPSNRLLHSFQKWMAKHNKVWKSAEEFVQRLEAFIDNHYYVEARNQQLMEEGASYDLGLNSFAHLTYEEFRQAYLQTGGYVDHVQRRRGNQQALKQPVHMLDIAKRGFKYENATDIPEFVDWRERGALTRVKDQGQCGSCWAFSTVATVEAAHQIATGELVSLSEQELVDCDRVHNQGCNGGLMDYAFEFIVSNGGLDTEADYPYTEHSGRCNVHKRNVHVVTIDDYEDVPESDEQALLKAVAHQPVSVAIDASGRDFQLYHGGVFTGSCGKKLNHAVVAVGYGREEGDGGEEYWVVRNSWGEGWGEGGYVRMARRGSYDPDGLCGINMEPSFPIICHSHSTAAAVGIDSYLRLPSQKL